jgi:acetyltransferase
MKLRPLDALLEPESVVVVGASDRPHRVGAVVWQALHTPQGGMRFEGPVWAVNLKGGELGGQPVYRRVEDLPGRPDLAVICTPPDTVEALMDDLGRHGCRAVIVITAGIDAQTKGALLASASRFGMRVLGPNGLGVIVPHLGLSASFSHRGGTPGPVALVSQSGALMTSLLDWAAPRGLGFSRIISLGEGADVSFADLLDYLAADDKTSAVLLYIESLGDARAFMSAASALSRSKPVIALKAGTAPAGQRAALSHTGAMASADRVVDAALRRAEVMRVHTLGALLAATQVFGLQTKSLSSPGLPALTVLTNGGGAGVMAADAAPGFGCQLAVLSESTLAKLQGVLPVNWSQGNPVDIIGDAPAERYVKSLEILRDAPEAGTVLLIQAPTAIVPSLEIAQALAPLAAGFGGRLACCWLGDASAKPAAELMRSVGVACFESPEEAVEALGLLQQWHRKQARASAWIDAPPANPATTLDRAWPQIESRQQRLDTLARVQGEAMAAGQAWLSQSQALELLRAYGIPTVENRVLDWSRRWPQLAAKDAARRFTKSASLAAELESLGRCLGFPLVLKANSPDIVHKSEAGAVILGLRSRAALLRAAEAMLKHLSVHSPQARLTGFTLQTQATMAHARELILGVSQDPSFGPLLLFGEGGTAVEVRADSAVALPPLEGREAAELVQRTRVSRLLSDWRHTPAADLPALHAALMSLSELVGDWPTLAELDINPLWAGPQGVLAVDARIRLGGPDHPAVKPALPPYPWEQMRQFPWQGRHVCLRAICPDDEDAYLKFLAAMDPVDIRLRVFSSRRGLTRGWLERMIRTDPDREIALVAGPGLEPLVRSSGSSRRRARKRMAEAWTHTVAAEGPSSIWGVARATLTADGLAAEAAVMVLSTLKGRGLGRLLLQHLIQCLRERGLQEVHMTVLSENAAMLALAHDLGFTEASGCEPADTQTLSLRLVGPRPGPD